MVGGSDVAAFAGRFVLHPRYSAAAASGAPTGGGRWRLYGGAGIRLALLARLSGLAQLLNFAQPPGASNGGDGPGHSVQRAGRLQPDLRPFRLATAGLDGRGAGKRLLQSVHPCGDDGDSPWHALFARVSRSAPFPAAALAVSDGAVSSWH